MKTKNVLNKDSKNKKQLN